MTFTGNAKLLVVDDDMMIRTLLSDVLSASSYDVRLAEDGFSALLEIRARTPDIIISDLNMPGMSGFELLPLVRIGFPSIRLIAMSGASSAESLPPEVTVDAFYEKGSGLDSLLQIVDAVGHPEQKELHF